VAIDREVLAAQELPNLRVVEHGRQELSRDLALEQPVAVGRERGRVPDQIGDPEPDQPAEQKVIVQLLHQQPLRANRVERLQQQRPHQPLGRNRGRPRCEYSASNSPDSASSASSTTARIGRSG
jgi:hypothetical protein